MLERSHALSLEEMPRFQVVGIGASAGGLTALAQLLGPLTGKFPAIVIVQHLHPSRRSYLAQVLSQMSRKPVRQAMQGEALMPGTVYVGPPGFHTIVPERHVGLERSGLIRYSRPSIDRMFESIAETYGERAIGVILSGANSDGADGIRAIHLAGGTTLAQEPRTAENPRMPQAAINTGEVDMVVPITEMATVLMGLFLKEWHDGI